MNITCIICSDLFTPNSEIFVTPCGHLFHKQCLSTWLERSKTCPQCRNKCSDRTIHRIYTTVVNTEGTDLGSILSKLDNAQLELSNKEQDLKRINEKYKKSKEINVGLRQELMELENKSRVEQSSIYALKEQISYLKSKSKDTDRLNEEIVRLRTRLKDVENLEAVIHGSREQVNDLLRNENNVESLALLVATLKKTLVDLERKKRELEVKQKQMRNESVKLKHENNQMQCELADLKKQLEQIKGNFDEEKKYLRNKILEMNKKDDGNSSLNSSVKRILDESPINFQKRPKLTETDSSLVDLTSTPPAPKRIAQPQTESPYLQVKSNGGLFDILSTKYSTKTVNVGKLHKTNLESIGPNRADSDIVYNGLGGSSKPDIFPQPKLKPSIAGLKKIKSTSSISSSKFKKLNPNAKRLMSNFVSNSQ